MPIPKISGEFYSENNYSAFTGENFNITLLNAKSKVSKHTDISFGFGNVWTYTEKKHKNVPAFEGIFNVNINDNLNTYARYRKFGKIDEYRVGFQGTCGIKSNQSIYAGTHYTVTRDEEWKRATGYWLGYDYEFKNGVSVSAEYEQGIELGGNNPSIGQTLGSFNDSNKTFNLVLSIPIGK